MTREELEFLQTHVDLGDLVFNDIVDRIARPDEYDWRRLAVSEICTTVIIVTVVLCLTAAYCTWLVMR